MPLSVEEWKEMATLANQVGDEQAELEALSTLETMGAFDVTLKQKASRVVGDFISPPAEDLPELDFTFQNMEPTEALKHVIAKGDTEATLGQDKYGNTVINTSEGRKFIDNPQLTLRDIAGLKGDIAQITQDVAPFLAGGVITAPLKAGAAAAIQGGIGVTTEAIDQFGEVLKGKGFNPAQVVTEGLFAAGGELGGRALFSVGAKVFQRMFGSSADEAARLIDDQGKLTDEALSRLSQSDATPKQINEIAEQELTKAIDDGALTAAEAKRFNFFKEQGIEPTKAQVTRKADDFQTQVDLTEQSTKVSARLEEQERIIASKFDDFAQSRATFEATSEVPAVDVITKKASARKEAISSAYKAARQEAPKDKIIRSDELGETLRKALPSNRKTDGSVASIRGYLMENGIIDKNFKPTGRISVETAEDARQFINSHYDVKNPFTNNVLRNLKDSLDNDVGRIVGRDAFKNARAAKIKFEKDLSKVGVSEFDTRKTNLVRDILENKVSRDDVVGDVVLAKKYRAEDLEQLVKYYKTGSTSEIIDGHAALGDLKKQTIQRIKEAAIKGAEGEAGVKNLSRAGLENILKKIGPQKLDILFPGAEGKFLKDMSRIARLREPTKGVSASPSGPAIRQLEDRIRKIPVFGDLVDVVRIDFAGKKAISNIQNTVKILERQQLEAAKRLATPVGAPLATELTEE